MRETKKLVLYFCLTAIALLSILFISTKNKTFLMLRNNIIDADETNFVFLFYRI